MDAVPPPFLEWLPRMIQLEGESSLPVALLPPLLTEFSLICWLVFFLNCWFEEVRLLFVLVFRGLLLSSMLGDS
jgi:hypothetical protein